MISYPHNSESLMVFLKEKTSSDGTLGELLKKYYVSVVPTASGSVQDMERQVLLQMVQGVGASTGMTSQDLWALYLSSNSLLSFEAWITAGGFVSNFIDNPTFGTSVSANRDDWDALSFGNNDTSVTVGAPNYFSSDQNVCNFKFASATGSRGLQQTKVFEAGDYTFKMKFHIKPAGAGSGIVWRIDGSTSGIIFNLNSATTNTDIQVDQDFTCVGETLITRVYSRNNSAHDIEWGEPEIVAR